MTREIYVGLMSGTSLDGVDAVLANFDGGKPRLLASACVPFDAGLRSELLALNTTGTDEIERAALAANELARKYAAAVAEVLAGANAAKSDVRAIGCDFLAFSSHKIAGPMGAGTRTHRQGTFQGGESRRRAISL